MPCDLTGQWTSPSDDWSCPKQRIDIERSWLVVSKQRSTACLKTWKLNQLNMTWQQCDLPFALQVWKRPWIQTVWLSSFGVNMPMSMYWRVARSLDMFMGSFPYLPSDTSGPSGTLSRAPLPWPSVLPDWALISPFLAFFSAFLASLFNCFSDFSSLQDKKKLNLLN